MLNLLYVIGRHPSLTAESLIAELDRGLADVAHRRAVVEDDVTGQAVADGMREAGYMAVPLMVMVLDGEPPAPPDGVVRVIEEDVMAGLARRVMDDDEWVPEHDRDHVVAGQSFVRSTVPGTRSYAGMLDGEDVCHTVLFQRDGTAQPENVVTMTAARGRGIAAATVARATLDALADGADLVFLVCDAATGPYALYAGLGYRAVGRFWTFTRPG